MNSLDNTCVCTYVCTFDMGMRKLSLKLRMVLVRSTMNTVKAAFSKSVSCTCRRHWRETQTAWTDRRKDEKPTVYVGGEEEELLQPLHSSSVPCPYHA